MKKKMVAFMGVAAFAALLAAAVFAYDWLQGRVDAPENILLIEATPALAPTAYDFVMQDSAGNEVRLSDFFGRPIVLNFWATWCPSCVRSSPYFDILHREQGDDVQVLKINLPGGRETRQAVDNFMAENGYTFPLFFDHTGAAAQAYGIRAIPDTVFICADGHITARIVGAVNARTMHDGLLSFAQ